MKYLFTVSAAFIFLGFFFPSFVSAHVIVSPSQAVSGGYQTFVMSVPSERDFTTTRVRLLIPEGAMSVRPNIKPGWAITLKKEKRAVGTTTTGTTTTEVVTEILWSATGSSVPAGFRDEFSFSIKTPSITSPLIWKAYQTYSDGKIVAWDAAPVAQGMQNHESTSGPYSQTLLLPNTGADAHGHGGAVSEGSHGLGHDLFIPLLALALAILGLHEIMAMKKQQA